MKSISATSPSWESDDTLSDGGEFLDNADFAPPSEELIRTLRAAIPIVPAVQSKLTSREGYLYKLSSKNKNRLGWHKRWVTFDSSAVKYFSSKTSGASKRIIPVNTMINVENDIKNADFLPLDSHEYRFKLTTVDRVYTFSTDDRDDLLMWTSLLMQAIIDAKTDDYHEGGDMCFPDREGYVKMEGVKHKRYLVIKGENFCYYNTKQDFKACSPIHQIPMKLASIKDLGKFKLRIITPAVSYILLLENQDEINGWKLAFEEAIASGLGEDNIMNEVYENHSNRFCADCGMRNPHWASVNLAITLCKNCAGDKFININYELTLFYLGIHRMLGLPLSKLMNLIGNDNSNKFWDWNSTEENRIDSDSDMEQKKDYILCKYQQKSFCHRHPLAHDLEALNEILHCSKLHGKNPLQLAKDAQQTLQVEFLIQNGAESLAEGKKSFNASQASFKKVNKYGIRGFLFKTGSNPKGDFLKRWVVLENGCLSYYENEKSLVAKDQITRKEMLSVACTSDERYEHSFELGTAKNGSRTYLFAAESYAERQKWIINLAKSIAPVRESTLLSVKTLDRGGIVYLRYGATKDWKEHWVHMRGRLFYIYQIEKDVFEEIDLRKLKSLTLLQTNDRCTDALDDGQPFVLDLPNRAIYIQGSTKKDTSNWFAAFTKATTEGGEYISDQQLTSDDVPLIVDKCINFIELHGMDSEGIYRLSGQTSVVTRLLTLFKNDARNVHIKMEDFSVNDVASSLKRFLRSLRDPIMMETLHAQWLDGLSRVDVASRLQWYKYLLRDLSTVNHNTLKRILAHLARIVQNEAVNKMGLRNLSAIFGPVLMNAGKEDSMSGFGEADKEMQVVHDLIEHHVTLFDLKEVDLEHERLINDAKKRIEQAMKDTTRQSTVPAGDMIIGIHVENGEVVNYKVPSTMTAEELTCIVREKAHLTSNEDSNWGLFEVISSSELERPIHYSEKVLDVVLQWGQWSEVVSRNNAICLKRNYVYDKIKLVFDPLFSLFSELRYSCKDRKAWKKFFMEFSHYSLHMRKDTKAAHPVCSWNAEDLSLYIGVQQRRSPPTKWGFTFITKDDQMIGPLVGHSVCCSNEEELFRWVAAILHAQQPLGLVPDGSLSPIRTELESQVPVGGVSPVGSRTSRMKQSLIHKLGIIKR
ncbi:hypothetical protein CAPTEDRAFT_226965 [Capitella teleta]|uniref:Arf-GAP with Rho-GAP domain, ANK repeat and PH domain-containing protein 1 n=1 Tax=Capitella teleta TaxID=283909 RepID=R7TAV0_CAPTE|nr:hypothetical protein CAPTEDRAFT_226965 [Capitella teleta]|eukprot:ELT90848.1 hypothetical protein CAPTEDRAFT_226965 [Capitella teleta]